MYGRGEHARHSTRSLRRDSAREVAEVEARVGRVGLAAALLYPRVEHDAEVRAVDEPIAVHVGAAGEAVTAGRRRDFDPVRRATHARVASTYRARCAYGSELYLTIGPHSKEVGFRRLALCHRHSHYRRHSLCRGRRCDE